MIYEIKYFLDNIRILTFLDSTRHTAYKLTLYLPVTEPSGLIIWTSYKPVAQSQPHPRQIRLHWLIQPLSDNHHGWLHVQEEKIIPGCLFARLSREHLTDYLLSCRRWACGVWTTSRGARGSVPSLARCCGTCRATRTVRANTTGRSVHTTILCHQQTSNTVARYFTCPLNNLLFSAWTLIWYTNMSIHLSVRKKGGPYICIRIWKSRDLALTKSYLSFVTR